MKIPALVLRQLYTNGSLQPTGDGVRFSLKNRLMDARLTALHRVTVDGREVPAARLTLTVDDGAPFPATEVSSTPLWTSMPSNGVPLRIDWPTIRCRQATGLPSASRPASSVCRYIGR